MKSFNQEFKDETYTEKMNCFNCDHNFFLDFPKGITCEGYYVCPRCGCTKAVRVKQVKEDFKSLMRL